MKITAENCLDLKTSTEDINVVFLFSDHSVGLRNATDCEINDITTRMK